VSSAVMPARLAVGGDLFFDVFIGQRKRHSGVLLEIFCLLAVGVHARRREVWRMVSVSLPVEA
jgi:hypothetical protein